MLESFSKDSFEYKKLTEEEQTKRGILGRLAGIMADTKNETRNGRRYSQKLWEKVFSNPIMQEKIENRCLFGELGHPENRLEVDMEKIAICLAEQPKMGKDGKLYGVFDILATPNGKILKTLCDYGCKIGVSSRGEGDVYTDYDGKESVDPDTYSCECWDAVLLPAVKEARPSFVTESVSNKKTLKQALKESLETAKDNEKAVMENTLKELAIDINEDFKPTFNSEDYKYAFYLVNPKGENITLGASDDLSDIEKQGKNRVKDILENPWMSEEEKYNYINSLYIYDNESGDEDPSADFNSYVDDVLKSFSVDSSDNHQETDVYIDEENDDNSAVDNGEAKVLGDLQEALAKINTLEHEKLSLNEKLSVCYAKEDELKEKFISAKKSVIKLTESLKKEKAGVVGLEKNVSELKESLSVYKNNCSIKDSKISILKEELDKVKGNRQRLSESVSKDAEKIKSLKESMSSMEDSFNSERQKLNEEITTLRKDCELIKGNYSKKIDKSNKLLEKYKGIANTAIEKYIDSKADMYGISKDDIRAKLGESYTFEDIENACSSLREYKINMNKLPFNFSKTLNESSKIKVNQKEITKQFSNSDDELDSQLIALSGLE